ncbi:MAG: ABC transporter substrate-binding protein [Minisyncoccales bacterium]|jgi:ABC-type nitrate/sulfonate/bicarbonate transport system substrate-binding protein
MPKKVIIIILSILMICGAVFVFRKRSSLNVEPKKDFASIAYNESDLMSRFVVRFAEREGLFEKNGLDVEIISKENFVYVPLFSDEVDLVIGPTSLIDFYFSPSVEMRWIGNLASRYNGYLVSREEYGSVSNIKRVGVSRERSIDTLKVEMVLKSMGVEGVEKISELSNDSKSRLLKEGKIDMALIDRPDIVEDLLNSGFYIWDIKDFHGGINYQAPHLFTIQKNIEKKEDEIARLVKSLVEAVELTIEDRDAAVKVLSREMGVDIEQADNLYQDYREIFLERDYIPSLDKIRPTLPFIISSDGPRVADRDLTDLIVSVFIKKAINQLGISK